MLRFAQHDIDEVARIATQSLKGEDVTKLTASESAPTFPCSLRRRPMRLCAIANIQECRIRVRTNRTFQLRHRTSIARDYFQSVSSTTPPTIMAALRTILNVTRSTSRKNIAVRISEKNGPVLLIGMTTETLPKSSA
jgi:hypothetical protein